MKPSIGSPGERTRTAIISAAMQGFAQNGFQATSTREIAARAKTNIASISYHFGSKEGLREACAAHVVEVMRGVTQQAWEGAAPPTDPEHAERQLSLLFQTMLRFLVLRPEAGPIAGFVLREMTHPSPALDTIYDGLFEKLHKRICALWSAATGQPAESDLVKLAVFSMIGQVVYFHLGRPVIKRRMGWQDLTRKEVEAITRTVIDNLHARIEADRRSGR